MFIQITPPPPSFKSPPPPTHPTTHPPTTATSTPLPQSMFWNRVHQRSGVAGSGYTSAEQYCYLLVVTGKGTRAKHYETDLVNSSWFLQVQNPESVKVGRLHELPSCQSCLVPVISLVIFEDRRIGLVWVRWGWWNLELRRVVNNLEWLPYRRLAPMPTSIFSI